jgi:hypothetical protein
MRKRSGERPRKRLSMVRAESRALPIGFSQRIREPHHTPRIRAVREPIRMSQLVNGLDRRAMLRTSLERRTGAQRRDDTGPEGRVVRRRRTLEFRGQPACTHGAPRHIFLKSCVIRAKPHLDPVEPILASIMAWNVDGEWRMPS